MIAASLGLAGLLGLLALGALCPRSTRARGAARLARALLACLGLRLRLRGRIPRGPVVFAFNHSSALDVLILVALGVPRARFFLSESAGRALPPLRWVGDSLGVFWTRPQREQAERRRRFALAARELACTLEPVFLSPEGRRVRTGALGPLNRGAFHLAISLGWPLVPLRIEIPPECDLDARLAAARGGVIEVQVCAPLRAENLDQLEDLRSAVARRLERAGPALEPARIGVDPTDPPLDARDAARLR